MTTTSSLYARIAGVLTLGVFAANVYIGLYDKVLQEVKVHWYLDWVIAALSLVAAGLLLAKPLTRWTVVLGGVVWPVVYVASLGFDVYTKLLRRRFPKLLPVQSRGSIPIPHPEQS